MKKECEWKEARQENKVWNSTSHILLPKIVRYLIYSVKATRRYTQTGSFSIKWVIDISLGNKILLVFEGICSKRERRTRSNFTKPQQMIRIWIKRSFHSASDWRSAINFRDQLRLICCQLINTPFFKSIFFLNHFLFFFFFLFSAFGISFSIFLPHKNIFVVVLSVFLFPTLILSLTANDRAVFYPQVSSVIFLYIYFPLCCFLPSKLISFAFFAFFFAFILDTG